MIHSIFGRKTFIVGMAFLFGLALALTDSKLFAQEPVRRPLLGAIDRCFKKMTRETKQTSPWGVSYGVASPTQGPAATQKAGAAWYGYGMGVPTYSYGWFGATYRPARASHTSYYGNTYQWGYRRGF
ncbi:MAG: hypothetical protein PVH19_01950 [Planctomycetia bacterium]|jgi:hypothetical protein